MPRDFDREWSTGYWDYMRGLAHVSRYGMLASLILHGRESPAVLDVGCGEGTLFEHLHGRARYLGFDLAPEAIARATERYGKEGARFLTGSVTDFSTEEKFDVIVFNAILYLVADKRSVVARYAKMLKPGGILLVENHTSFRDARGYLSRVGEAQDAKGWNKISEVVPFDWLKSLFQDYQHEAHYTLLNWSVANKEFPCRHVHIFRLREPAAARPASVPSRAGFSQDSAPYIFGTENMVGVLEGLSVRGKSVLTVLGGSDQLLNFICAGAREVVGFDIARNASYVAELKFAALRAYDRERYFSTMLALQNGPLAKARDEVAPLLATLSEPAARYFRESLDTKVNIKVRSRNPATLTQINPYLQSDEAYLRTRANLGHGQFITADIFALPQQLERRFDVVYAANVLDFNRAGSPEAVDRLWKVVEPGGCVCSYEFASHKRAEGEYGPGVVTRNEFDGKVYGKRDFLAVIRRADQPLPAAGADAEVASLQAALDQGPIDGFGPIGKGAQSSQLQRASAGGRLVVLRAPRAGTKVDSFASFRSHRVMRALAFRIGAPHLALPTAFIDTPDALRATIAASKMVVTPLLPEGARSAGDISSKLLAAISEEDRLAAAVLCVLTAQCDAVPKNVFMLPEGQPVLLDLDNCLGRPIWWAGGANPICFAPGGRLAYRSSQASFSELPPVLAALVRELAAGDACGLEGAEAEVMKSSAAAIIEQGLTAAALRHLRPKASAKPG